MDFLFPDVGEGLTEGTLVKWLVKVGDTIKLDQPLAQVETDKAVVDIPSPTAGVVKELVGEEGSTLTVGTVMARFGDAAEASAPAAPEEVVEVVAEAPKPVEVALAVDEKKAEPVPEVPTPVEVAETKVSPKVEETVQMTQTKNTSSSSEILATPAVRKYAKEHKLDLSTITGTGKHGQILIKDLDASPAVSAAESPSVAPVEKEPTQKAEPQKTVAQPQTDESVHPFIPLSKDSASAKVLATPSIRRLAREKGVDILTITGSGPNGRILESDLDGGSAKKQSAPVSLESQKVPKPAPAPSAATVAELGGDSTRVPLSKTRQVIAKRMVESLQHTASVTTSEEVDVTDLYGLYETEKAKLKDQQIRLSFLAFITKIVTMALKKFPVFNSTLDDAKNELIMHNNIHIGIAVAAPNGLLVPVIKQADQLSITQLAQSISDLAVKARDGKLTMPEMSGSTFTISNIGSIGGAIFTPIINYPEVAILGIGRTVDKPAVVEGEITIRKLVWLSLTFDHRVGDGADAAFFLNTIKKYLEDEKSLLVDLS